MDISALAPDLGRLLGINPSTLVLLLFLANIGARAAARSIPSDATGFWGFVRQVAAIVGAEVPNQITKDANSTDVLKAVAKIPPVPETMARDEGAAS